MAMPGSASYSIASANLLVCVDFQLAIRQIDYSSIHY
uniref:Uncharacterized protein n=1 Tax=Erwinia amylovora ATCC BAA-2158 TaxID=889211 RepID=E5B138_ERWAM|nr:hypothetical protein predicted by Glimmer/Critica [Erwinia amylovora ATCC BAA-2158]